MSLSKPSDFFNNNENSLVAEEDVNDSFNQYKLNSDKLDYFVSKIDVLSEKLSTKIDKSDLENAMFSQLIILEDNIKKLKSSYEGMGKLKNDMIREEFNDKLNDIAEAIDNNIQILNDKFEQSSIRLRRDVAVYNNLTKIIEGKVDKLDRDDEKISLIEKTTVDLDKKILDVDLKSDIVGEEIGVVRGEIDTKINDVVESIDDKFKRTARSIKFVEESTDKLDHKISNTKVELELKNDNLSRDIDSISERVDIKVEQIDTKIGEITQLVEDKSKSDSEEINIVKEDNVKFKRSVSDNLVEYKIKTDYNLKEITNSIDLFIEELKKETDKIDNRVNQIVEDNKNSFKKYDTKLKDESTKFDNKIKNVVEENNNSIEEYASKLRNEITDVKVDVVINEKTIKKIDKFLNENHQELIDLKEEVFSQIKNLPLENLENNISKLESKIDYIRETYSKINTEDTVKEVIKEGLLNEPPNKNNGDPLSKNDFVTLPQLQEHYRLFINRIQQQLSTLGGGGETRLKHLDDIVGIATNPSEYDNKFLAYDDAIKKFEFKNVPEPSVTLAEENITYVAKDGDDSNDGTIGRPKLTIKNAVESIVSTGKSDQVVRVAPGTYIEDNPIILPDELTVIGHSLRENTVIPLNDDKDLFYVGNGNYIAEMSFRGSLPGKAIVAFDPEKPRYIVQSPYIQNCTNFIPDSIGLRIDGDATIGPLKSMVLDSYTQYNQGGIGCSITNQGYAQLVSMFTICDEIAVFCGSGGACDLTNSNSSFGNFGIVADGVSGKLFSGIVTTAASELSDTFELILDGPELSVSNALYDNATGLTTITTSSNHNLNVGAAVTISDLKFTCDSFTDIEEYTISNAVYDEQSGILTVTTAEQNDLSVGISVTMSDLKFSCDSFVPVIDYNVSNAIYDNTTGIITVTTSTDHNFSPNVSVAFTGLKFSCNSFVDIIDYNVSNAVYDNTTGIITVTTSTDHNFSPNVSVAFTGLKFSCNSFVGNTVYNVSNAVYDNISGILTVTTATDHNFSPNISVDFADLVFECDSGGGLSTAFFPPGIGDGNGDPDATTFEVLSTPTFTTFTVNVGPSTIAHTYQEGGTVAIGTITTFPSGRFGNVFEVLSTPSSTTFTANVGVSTFVHTYEESGVVSISTITTFPSGRFGNVFEVLSAPSSTTFTANVGVSTFVHTYQEGGTVAIGTITTFPSGREGFVFDVTKVNSSTEFTVNVGVSTFIHSYVSGGNVSISTIANFPNGNQGYVFNVQKINSSTEFETYVGVSTFIHTYDSGGNVKLNLVRPYDGTLLFFNELYETVDSVTITDGGSGYTESPIVTISEPSEPWGIRARAIANVSNGSITSIDMISNGRGYTSDATVTIADNSSGINTAVGVAVMQPEYYAVVSSTEISGGITTVTVNENVPFSVGVGTTVNFYKQSRILASGHSFEFVGAGNDISRATPFSGGFPPIPENETVSKNGGLVIFTSTNQSGNFKIGDGVTINQSTSSITGQAYEKSLISTMTPYILSLGAL